jgi:hypothetical protein
MFVHFNPKRLRLMRLVAAVALVLLTLSVYLTSNRHVGVRTRSESLVSVRSGCFTIGHVFGAGASGGRGRITGESGVFANSSYQGDWTLAWRPFHATETLWPTTAKLHLLVVPLLPFVLGCALVTGWAHGRLRGLRDARSSNCLSCGYDLSATPITDGKRACPECGAKRGPVQATGDVT